MNYDQDIPVILMYSLDSERSVIGAILQDPQIQQSLPTLPSGLMFAPVNEHILTALKQMYADKTDIDLLTVSNYLSERGDLDNVGGAAYLLQCIRATPTTANYKTYVATLRKYMETRNAHRMATEFCTKLITGDDLSASVDALRSGLRDLITPKGSIVRMSDMAQAVYEDIELRASGKHNALATRIPDLDRLLGGLEGGDLMVIGARPAVGKSALGMQIAINVAQQGKSVLICSREMSTMQYGHRLASNVGMINGQKLKRGKLAAGEWDALSSACNDMSRLKLAFTFQSSTIEDLRVMAQHEKDMGGLDLIVVDYLQILNTTRKTGKRYEEVGIVSRSLKELALDLQVPVIAMAQVGRQTVSQGAVRTPLMPSLSDLRESGSIEQDADIVVFMHHPTTESDPSIPSFDLEMWRSLERMDGHQYAVLRVDKQRQGECGSFGIDFDAAHMHFTCIQR